MLLPLSLTAMAAGRVTKSTKFHSVQLSVLSVFVVRKKGIHKKSPIPPLVERHIEDQYIND
jgi:hypothetical protein